MLISIPCGTISEYQLEKRSGLRYETRQKNLLFTLLSFLLSTILTMANNVYEVPFYSGLNMFGF